MEFIEDDDTIEVEETYRIMAEEMLFKKVISRNKGGKISSVNIEEVITAIESTYQIKFQMLKCRLKNREVTKIKDEFIKKVIKFKSMNQEQLSELLEVSEQTISRIVNKV